MIYKYSHPEWFDGIKQPDLQAFNRKIIIHGTAMMGAVAAYVLERRKIEFTCFSDNDHRRQGKKYIGHDVFSPSDAFRLYPDALVLVASSAIRAIGEMLTEIGFSHIYDCFTLFKEFDMDGFYHDWSNEQVCRSIDAHLKKVLKAYDKTPKKVIHTMSVGITTRCNLRCRECTQYITQIKNPKDYDYNVVASIIERITTEFGFNILNLQISMGESLLHRYLHLFLHKLAVLDSIEVIYIVTNGTLIPIQEVVDALKSDPRIIVRVSNYGKLSTRFDELCKILRLNGIKYEVTNYLYWVKFGSLSPKKMNNEQLADKFHKCACNDPLLVGSKLYYCFSEFAVEATGTYKGKNTAINFSDDLTDSQIYNGITGMLRRKNAIPACQYCNKVFYENFPHIPAAEQLEG